MHLRVARVIEQNLMCDSLDDLFGYEIQGASVEYLQLLELHLVVESHHIVVPQIMQGYEVLVPLHFSHMDDQVLYLVDWDLVFHKEALHLQVKVLHGPQLKTFFHDLLDQRVLHKEPQEELFDQKLDPC